jgi:hypothetical protein
MTVVRSSQVESVDTGRVVADITPGELSDFGDTVRRSVDTGSLPHAARVKSSTRRGPARVMGRASIR